MSTDKSQKRTHYLGLVLKVFRLEKHLTLKDMAAEIGTSASYLSEVERGLKMPGSELIFSLKRSFPELDLNELFQIRDRENVDIQDIIIKEPDSDPEFTAEIPVDYNPDDLKKQAAHFVNMIENLPLPVEARKRILESYLRIVDEELHSLEQPDSNESHEED